MYADKLVEVTDIAEYLGSKYGGWKFLAREIRQARPHQQLDLHPARRLRRPHRLPRLGPREAGFDRMPEDHAGFLRLCQALKRNGKPAGFALGNAVGDGNGKAEWLIWSHGGYLVDEDGKVAINSRETVEALNYMKELYPTFMPGTLSWRDPSNNRAYTSRNAG